MQIEALSSCMVLSHGCRLAGTGILAGLGGGLLISRLLKSLLFEINGADPLSYAAVSLTALGVILAACFVPAWRASRMDPVGAIRESNFLFVLRALSPLWMSDASFIKTITCAKGTVA